MSTDLAIPVPENTEKGVGESRIQDSSGEKYSSSPIPCIFRELNYSVLKI